MRLVSYNVLGFIKQKSYYPTTAKKYLDHEYRQKLICQRILEYASVPDTIIALQEVATMNIPSFIEFLKEHGMHAFYKSYGRREINNLFIIYPNTMVPIAAKCPMISACIIKKEPRKHYALAVNFKDIGWIVNYHMPNKWRFQELFEKEINLFQTFVKTLGNESPIVIAIDSNIDIKDKAYKTMMTIFSDYVFCWNKFNAPSYTNLVQHQRENYSGVIDHILCKNIEMTNACVDIKGHAGVFMPNQFEPSDHCAIMASFN